MAKIQFEQKIMEKESLKKMSLIEDEMMFNREKMKAEAEYYTKERWAQGNKLLLTPQYIELKKYEAIAQNAKLYFGANIPNMFVEKTCKYSFVKTEHFLTICFFS